MKKFYTLFAALLLTLSLAAQTSTTTRGFVHPGGLHTQEDFDRIKTLLASGNETITAAFNVLKNAAYAQPTAGTYPVATIVRGGTGENYINAARGATIAYQNALMWKITGNEDNARHAVDVLMQWAGTTKAIGGNSNYALAAGIYGYEFAQAAELMRDYEGWTPAQFRRFQQWMLQVWYPSAIGFLRARNGTWENSGKWWQAPGHYWSNWGLCNALCVMSIGVLCDDVFIYNQGLSFIKYDQVGTFRNPRTANPILNDGLTEFWGNLIVTTQKSDLETGAYGELGQMNESGRDIGHATMALGLAIDIAHMAWNQGDDLFSYMDNRLAAGIEYIAAQTQSIQGLPWTDYKYGSSGYAYSDSRCWTMTEPALGEQIRPYWGTVIGHYEGVLGVKMPFSEWSYQQMTANGPDGGGQGSTSGGYDHLGYSVLMNYRDHTATADEVPTLLTPKMVVDGDTINHNELGGLTNTYQTNNNTGVKPGTVVKLLPQLRDGSADTGDWLWDSGETTRNLTVTATESHVWRVTYTNAHGVKSHLCFSIAVEGDCEANPVTASATYDGKTYSDSVTIFYGDDLTLNASSTGNYGTYSWSNGETGSTITAKSIKRDTLFVVTYKNQGGALTHDTLRVNLKYLRPQMYVNGKVKEDTVQYVCQLGDNVIFRPYIPASFRDIDCRWSSGSTARYTTYNHLSGTVTDTLIYTIYGKSDTLYYAAYVSDTVDSRIPVGNYLIRDRVHDTYLTNNSIEGQSYTPCTFTPLKEGEALKEQVWSITDEVADNPSYNLLSTADNRFLSLRFRMTGTARSPFYFRKALGRDWYQLHNAAPRYFVILADGTTNNNTYSTPTDFPLELIPYNEATGISSATVKRVDNDAYYNLSGQRVGRDYKGIVIHNGRKIIRR